VVMDVDRIGSVRQLFLVGTGALPKPPPLPASAAPPAPPAPIPVNP